MNFWQEINFSIQWTNFVNTTTIRTDFIFCNQTTDFSVFHLFKNFSHITHDCFIVFIIGVAFFVNSSYFFFDSFCCCFTRFFLFDLNSFLKVRIVSCNDFSLQSWVNLKQFNFCFFFTNSSHNFFLEGNQFLNCFMSFKKSFKHDIF